MERNEIQPLPHTSRGVRTFTRYTLPKGAIARLGEGYVWDIALSPDGDTDPNPFIMENANGRNRCSTD